MGMIAVSGRISERDAQLIKAVVAGIMPDIHARFDELEAENRSLLARISEIEAREPVAGPPGEKGEPGENGKDGIDGKDGQDGASVTPNDVAPLIVEQVAKAVAEIPVPNNGKDGSDGKDGRDGTDGKDGAGIIDGFVSRDGHLIATLSDGTTRDFGEIVGKDGQPGKDGRDGFGFEDMDVAVLDDDRTIELSFRRGEEEKAFTLKWPTMIYRGVYKAEGEYAAGDSVTWGGSLWVAEKDTDAKPDTPDSGWKLAVKKGRDGKDAKNG